MHNARRRHRTPMVFIAALCTVAALAGAVAPTASAAPTRQSGQANKSASRPAQRSASQSYNGLALTPPMGWNDWYQYRCGVTENDVLANARAMVSSGLARLGYNYINLDDCWMAPQRAADGALQGAPTRFPPGV